MGRLQIISLIGLFIYFAALLYAVARDKKNKNILDYFFGGRTLPFWMLSITFIASWWGAGSAISTADLAYTDGIGAFWYYGVPVLLATFLMILGSRAIRRVGYLTQGEMMEARYSPMVAKIMSLTILLFMTFSAASQVVGVGDFFGTYLNLNYEVAIIVGTGIVLIYSMFGGFRGVVLTDVIQFVLLAISAIIVFVVAMSSSGGIGAISQKAIELGKPEYMSVTAGASKYFSYVITFGCAWMIQANVWQRISAAKTDKEAYKMTVMSFIAFIPLYLIVVFTGMAGINLFEAMPKGGIVATIVMEYMSPVLGALVFVGISAAIMSTMDSLINTGAMTIVIDLNRNKGDEQKQLSLSRIATLGVTMVAVIIAISIRSILEISWIASDIITTGMFIPLVFGFIWRRGNSKGAMASMVVGLIYSFYNLLMYLGVSLPAFWEPQTTVQALLGVLISAVVYIGVSLCTEPEYEKADSFIAMADLFGRKK